MCDQLGTQQHSKKNYTLHMAPNMGQEFTNNLGILGWNICIHTNDINLIVVRTVFSVSRTESCGSNVQN